MKRIKSMLINLSRNIIYKPSISTVEIRRFYCTYLKYQVFYLICRELINDYPYYNYKRL